MPLLIKGAVSQKLKKKKEEEGIVCSYLIKAKLVVY